MNKIKSLFTSLKNGWSTPPKGRYLTFKEMACYGFSGLGVSFIVNVITAVITASQIPYIYEIDVIHGTIIFSIVGVSNLLIQPFFGKMLQNTKSKFGRYKPYIIGIAPVISLFVVLATWLPQVNSMTFRVVYAYCTCIPVLVLWNIWYNTFYMIPAAMTPVSQERTDMLSPVGLIMGFAPTVMNFIIGPIRAHFMSQGREYMAFRLMGLISTAIGVILVFLIMKTKERIYETPQERENISVKEGLRLVMQNKPLMIYTLAMIIGSLRGVAEMNSYYIGQFRYGETTEQGLSLFSMLSPIVGFAATPAMLLLPFMTRKMNNKSIMIMWQAINTVAYGVLCIIGYENIPVGTPTAVVITVIRFVTGFNAVGTLTPIMLSEIYDYQQWKTGRRLEGFIQTFAVSMTGLVSQFAMFIPTFIQQKIGYQPMNFKNGAEYLPENIAIMNQWFNISAVITVVSGILFIAVMAFYPLSKKKYNQIMEELKEKSSGIAEQ
jgi:Na+/melibiose symporter-like transporter